MVDQRFLALLTNAGKGIEKLNLKRGFIINKYSEEEITKLVSLLDGINLEEARVDVWVRGILNPTNKMAYCITKSLNFKDSPNWGYLEVEENLIKPYLNPLIIKLRLFKEGDIGYNRYYLYNEKNFELNSMTRNNFSVNPGDKFELSLMDEIKECNKFINHISLTHNGQIKLALDNFNLSYNVISDELAFLCLMMSMETLYSESNIEATFRFTRNCAIFLGKTKNESEKIYKDMMDLYKIRSHLIHGRINRLPKEKIKILRDYVRKSITRYVLINETPKMLVQQLDKLGFGDYTKIK